LATEIVDIGLKRMPNSYRLLVQKGVMLDGLGRRTEAKEIFRSAMKLRNDNSVALVGLAIIELNEGETARAVQTLGDGFQKFPSEPYLLYCYGYALAKWADMNNDRPDIAENARSVLQRAVRLNSEYPESYYHLGKVYLRTDKQAAIRNFEMALQLDPTYSASKYQLARLYMQTGRREEGLRLMSEVQKDMSGTLEDERKPQLKIVRR